MSEIEQLGEQVQEAEELVEEYQNRIEDDRGDFADELALSSARNHRNQLREELQELKEQRKSEIVEFRLRGNKAIQGTLPLGVLSKLAGNIERQIYAAAYFIKSTKRLVSRVPNDLLDKIDLRLAGLRPGSSRMMIVGDLSPDLFGKSMFEETLTQIFQVLQAGDEELEKYVSEIGPIAARKMKDMADRLIKEDLQVDIKWNSPSGKIYEWQGTTPRLGALKTNLNQIESHDPKVFSVEGRVKMISSKGKFRIDDEENEEEYEGKYSPNIKDSIEDLSIEDEIEAEIEKVITENLTTGRKKIKYRLKDISYI